MRTPRVPQLSHVKRPLRILIGLTLTALAVGYILLKIDVHQTWDVLTSADPWWFALSVAIMIGTALPMALRWQWLLAAQRIVDRFWWLTRAYFVSYTAGQILPTSIGGDAVRIFETAKRHPGRSGDLTAIVLIERGLGGAATVLLGAIGFVLAIGHYDVSAYLWLEGAFVFGTILLLVLFFSRRARPLLGKVRPLLVRVRVERPLRAFYEGVHHYRSHPGLLLKVFVFTTAIQAVRILADLGILQGGGDRPRPAHLLRDGPAVLPRPARAVHAERLRGPGGVLRQLPRQRRRRCRPGVRGRLPLLPRHGRARRARRRDPPLGVGARGRPP